ncbi:MAG: hypothetical protein M3Y68_14830 [Chloroflexota bacterium]|nr:hypothetical protein [Chloroflexota bacterium]
MPDDSHKTISSAILETVAYADIFDHPLTAPEIHRYLCGVAVPIENLRDVLKNIEGLVQIGDHFMLPGREEIIPIREKREARSQKLLPVALSYGRMLGSSPFIRMVALTGSLAVLNVSKTDDFDYMLVAAPGRVWMARAFALLINRFAKRFGHTICPNLIVSRNCLQWPLHDLYSARELCQMIPISGMDVYHELIQVNAWARDFLPNAFSENYISQNQTRRRFSFQERIEFFLSGQLGDRFERWEMARKIERFSKQDGFGNETVFNGDVCQGNFHHHRKWTHEAYERRLRNLHSPVLLLSSEKAGDGTV